MNIPFLSRSSRTLTGHRISIDPRRDWFVVLGIAMAFLLASIAGNLWLFHLAIQDRTIGDGSGSAEAQPLDLERMRALFAERASERARYIDGYGFTDPSR
jgi:hypothetical protein